MNKKFFASAIALTLVINTIPVMASDIVQKDTSDPNSYVITDNLQKFQSSDDLWIGTLSDWKDEGKKVGSTNTVFENGEALHDDDIIITNGIVGASIAVGTRNPWGYPAGSVLDIGKINNWVGGRDTIWSGDFLVNSWDFWGPTNCGDVTFDLVKYNFDPEVKAEEDSEDALWAVKVNRMYVDTVKGVELEVDTYYGIAPGENEIKMFDKITNLSGKDTHPLSSRFAITNKGDDGGAMFMTNQNCVIGTYGKTDKNIYTTTLSLPGSNTSNLGIDHKFDFAGTYLGCSENIAGVDGTGAQPLLKDEVVTFDTYFHVSDDPSTELYNDFLIDYYDKEANVVSGVVKDLAGNSVKEPIIVVENEVGSYGWYMGEEDGTFSFKLPDDDKFVAYIEQDGYANGDKVEITDQNLSNLELTTGVAKEKIKFNLKDQNGNPVYGKVELFAPTEDGGWESAYPTVRFCGNSVYLAYDKGEIEADITAGKYKAVVYGEGFWFYSDPVEIIADTADGDQDVTVEMVYDRPEGWVSGDLHHHGNKNDAFVDPTDALPSLAASAVDVPFITDHDFTVNNELAYKLSSKYERTGYLPAEEISCSWAHFNVLPLNEEGYKHFLDVNQNNNTMNQFAQLPVFVKQTHDNGAAITANHPWQWYGLFYAYQSDVIPGGYTDDYDTVEINAYCPDNENLETIASTMELWSAYLDGISLHKDINDKIVYTHKPHYFVGGSDTHDVRYPGFAGEDYTNIRSEGRYSSGKFRSFAYVGETTDGDIMGNGLAFSHAIVDGNSYVSSGPLLTLDKLPGNAYNVKDSFKFTVDVESLANIKDVAIITKDSKDNYLGAGKTIYSEKHLKHDATISKLDVNSKNAEYTFEVPVADGESTWVAIFVIDENGNFAITNPYWVYGEGAKNGFATRCDVANEIYNIPCKFTGTATDAAKAFSDVTVDQKYAEAIDWAYDNSIAKGYNGNYFPNENITKQDLISMLYRLAQYNGENVYPSTDTISSFDDANEISEYAVPAMNWAYSNGIISSNGSRIYPKSIVTKEELCKIIDCFEK